MVKSSSKFTIFVSIAAYRDSETPKTIADLYAKADYPERIFIGVINQLDLPTDEFAKAPDHPRIRQTIIPHGDSKGACWARHKVFDELLRDEDFVIQIDSHMRFDQGWDSSMLEQYFMAQDENAVLTHYPMPYNSTTNICDPQMYTKFNCQMFDDLGIPKISSAAHSLVDAPVFPEYTIFLAGGCFFTRSSTVREVSYDPYLYFNGEEINYAIRLWTHGYNLYLPNRPFIYHDYGCQRGRRLHWTDNPDWVKANALSQSRLRYLLGIEPEAPEAALTELDKYSLGTKRSLTQWQQQHGILISKKLLCSNVFKGDFKQAIDFQ